MLWMSHVGFLHHDHGLKDQAYIASIEIEI